MRIFSKKLINWFHSHERDALYYGVIIVYLAVAIVGFFWHRETTELRIGLVTNLNVCTSGDFDTKTFTQKAQRFTQESHQYKVHFLAALGNTVLHEKEACEPNAAADFAWVRTLLTLHKTTHFILGTDDVFGARSAYEVWLSFIERDKTYYSFDRKNTHVIVLDTTLGGDALSPECEDIPACNENNHRWQFLRTLLKDEATLADYLERHETTYEAVREERDEQRKIVQAQEYVIEQTRSKKSRRIGRVGDSQLRWLRDDLANTKKDRVLILSHHPLFFVDEGGKQPIDIDNRDSVTLILKESGKDIVSVSGGTNKPHEHRDNNIRYFSITKFDTANGPWTYLSWSAREFIIEQK